MTATQHPCDRSKCTAKAVFRIVTMAAAVMVLPGVAPRTTRGESPPSTGAADRRGTSQEQSWRSQMRSALFIPDPLPRLDPQTHGTFQPTAEVRAERVTYGSQFGLRIPAIVYSPQTSRGPAPALIVVNGHGGDKYSWYAFYSGILYARAGMSC